MKKRFFSLLIVICLLLTATGIDLAASPNPITKTNTNTNTYTNINTKCLPINIKLLPIDNTFLYFQNKKWGTLGDSITVNSGNKYGSNYRTLVQKILGIKTVQNAAISGSMIARKPSYSLDTSALCLQYNKLNNDCNIITVFGGTNDYRGAKGDGIPIGIKGSDDVYTYYGALKTLIEGLMKKYPKEKILFITPLRRTNDTIANQQGYKLIDYVNAIKDMCADYSIPVLDLYNEGGINRLNSTTLTTDGLHPNATGYQFISRKIAKFIEIN